MQAVSAVPVLGPTVITPSGRIERTRASTARDGDPGETSDAGHASGGVVYSFSAHAAAARARRQRGDSPDEGLDPDRRGQRAFAAQGPGGDRRALSATVDELPDSLGAFTSGSALEAQLLTPALRQLHATVLARQAQ